MLVADFAESFWSNVFGGLASGAVIAAAAYVLVDRRLRTAERREARRELVLDVLREVKRELAHDREQADILLEHAPKAELPFPLFDVNGWTLLTQAEILIALEPETTELLVKTYNRLRTANEQFALAYDLLAGQSAAIHGLLASAIGTASAEFTEHRRQIFDALTDRVTELGPVLKDAREHVDAELAER